MFRILTLMSALLIALSACTPSTPQLGNDGKPLPKLYKIGRNDAAKIQFRMLDSVNALRQASALAPLTFDSKLNAAAATHSRDMSIQNRPWHFGSDGSSPVDRVNRVDFDGGLVGELISETYETELETLAAWTEQPDTRRVILASEAQRMGFSWFQENNGKIWWTLVIGTGPQTTIEPTPAF
ncbi:MAG: CAP domain-containing protein [Aliishimia sp.]